VGVSIGIGISVGVGICVSIGIGISVGISICICICVGVGVRVSIRISVCICICVGVRVSIGSCVGVIPIAATATPTASRLEREDRAGAQQGSPNQKRISASGSPDQLVDRLDLRVLEIGKSIAVLHPPEGSIGLLKHQVRLQAVLGNRKEVLDPNHLSI